MCISRQYAWNLMVIDDPIVGWRPRAARRICARALNPHAISGFSSRTSAQLYAARHDSSMPPIINTVSGAQILGVNKTALWEGTYRGARTGVHAVQSFGSAIFNWNVRELLRLISGLSGRRLCALCVGDFLARHTCVDMGMLDGIIETDYTIAASLKLLELIWDKSFMVLFES